MANEKVTAQIEAATAEQLESDTVRQQISTSVEAALGEKEVYRGIVSLKGQLDRYNAFYLGSEQYRRALILPHRVPRAGLSMMCYTLLTSKTKCATINKNKYVIGGQYTVV